MFITDELLLNYKRCKRRAFLNIYGNQTEKDREKDFLLKLRKEGENHTKNILEKYYSNYQQPQKIEGENWTQLAQETLTLMREGVDTIYYGKLHYIDTENISYFASPTLLIKQNIPSIFGDWSYSIINIQLGKNPKPEYKILASFASIILSKIQDFTPSFANIILRDQNSYRLNLNIWIPRTEEVIIKCINILQQKIEPEVFISRQQCSLCQWQTSCYQIAKKTKHLSLVPGITPSRYELLQKNSIFDLKSLGEISPEKVNYTLESSIIITLQKQAQSLLTNTPILKENSLPFIPNFKVELYFDIEAEPEINTDYLLGILLIDKENNYQQYYSFFAEKPTDEAIIWQQFLDFLTVYSNAPIFHYSAYEVETIRRLGLLYHTPIKEINALLDRFFDLHKYVLNNIILPIENYSLKAIANWLNFYWRSPNGQNQLKNGEFIGGDQCVVWYDQWLITGDRQYIEYILRYNEDDCLATFHLKNWLMKYYEEVNF